LTKNRRKRDVIEAAGTKQSTLDNVSFQFNIPKPKLSGEPTKAIIINEIISSVKDDEFTLSVDFTLIPSKASFSKVNLDLFFDDQLLNSLTLRIPQSTLLNDKFVYPLALNMKGISQGNYLIRIEMYELWSSDEKLNFTSKTIVLDYIPQTKETRLLKVPIVKHIADSNLTVVSSSARTIYQELERDQKRELSSNKDEW